MAVAASGTAAPEVQGESPLLLPERLGQLVRTGDGHSYSRENLFEYINGHAEFYLSAGFVALVGSEYRLEGKPPVMIQVDVYDMGRDLYAFGALMEGAGGQGRPVKVGTRGFETDTVLTFVAGPYLFKLSSSAPDSDLPKIGARLLKVLKIEASAELEVEFPKLGEVTRTTFIKENYKSLDFLADVVERRFVVEGQEITAFTTKGPDGSNATKVRTALLDFLEYDEIPVEIVESGGFRVHVVDDPYEGKWFFLLLDDSLFGVFTEPTPALLASLHGSRAVSAD